MTSTGKKKKEQRTQRMYTYILMKNQNEIGTEERRRRQKKNVRHQTIILLQNNNWQERKERTEITKNMYLHAIMKNQNEIGTEERRRRQMKNVRHQIIILLKNNK